MKAERQPRRQGSTPRVVVVIPARGGSKGIPRKNLRHVGGLPLVGRAIQTAKAAGSVGAVFVSTDDAEIAAAAARYGAEVIERPAELGADDTSSEAVLLHALDVMATRGVEPELTAFVQCTAPLITSADIDGVVAALDRESADSAFAAAGFHGFLWKTDASQGARGVNHSHTERKRRQDLSPTYLEAGSVYVFRTSGFRASRHRFFGRIAVFEIPVSRCVEVDDEADIELAEALLRGVAATAANESLPQQIGALVMDFDGVLTDNRVVVFSDGQEAVACSRADGMGIGRLAARGLPMLILSAEKNPVVDARASKLGIACRAGVTDKRAVLEKWLAEMSVVPRDCVYVGNDVNDLACMQYVGCGVAVADAHPDVLRAASLVLRSEGGRGAVRELTDLIEQRLAGGAPCPQA
jgi:YrbI family 3-deoxy-D-manno-octulosonate 8-phosphate phosphatase